MRGQGKSVNPLFAPRQIGAIREAAPPDPELIEVGDEDLERQLNEAQEIMAELQEAITRIEGDREDLEDRGIDLIYGFFTVRIWKNNQNPGIDEPAATATARGIDQAIQEATEKYSVVSPYSSGRGRYEVRAELSFTSVPVPEKIWRPKAPSAI